MRIRLSRVRGLFPWAFRIRSGNSQRRPFARAQFVFQRKPPRAKPRRVPLPNQTAPHIDLPSSKQLIGEAPGNPQRINSLPISMAVSPDGRYVVTVNAGYGTFESQYEQSLSVLDTQTGALADFPDARTTVRAKQTLYSGLAFSRDGSHIYASMASLTRSERRRKDGGGQRNCGLQLRRRKDRARAADSSARGAAAAGAKDTCCPTARRASRACRIQRRLR